MHFFLKQRQKPQKTAQKKGQQSTGPNNMFFFRKKVRSASNQHWPPHPNVSRHHAEDTDTDIGLGALQILEQGFTL